MNWPLYLELPFQAWSLHVISQVGVSSVKQGICFHSSGQWLWTLQSTRPDLAHPWWDAHGSKYWRVVRWEVKVGVWAVVMVLLVVGGVGVHSGPLVEQDKTDQILKQMKNQEREREGGGGFRLVQWRKELRILEWIRGMKRNNKRSGYVF
jgi:hypothetical protein